MGQTQSLQQTQTPTQASLAAPTSIKAKRITKKPQPYATSFFEAQMLDSPDVSMGRVKNTAPNYFEFASTTPQPIRKTSSAYNVHTSSTSASAKTSSTTSSVKKIYPGQRSLSLSTVPSTKDGEDLSEISTSFTLDKNYITINNRRYWKDKNNQMQFILPCDDDESDRLMSLVFIEIEYFFFSFLVISFN